MHKNYFEKWNIGLAYIRSNCFYACISHHRFVVFCLLFHQLADDEALIILLQTSLFLIFPYAVDNCMPLSSKSSLTLSIHLFLCLPLLLSPLTCPCSAAFGSLFPSNFSMCPSHSSLLLLIFSITVSAPSSSLVFSFLILSLLPFLYSRINYREKMNRWCWMCVTSLY